MGYDLYLSYSGKSCYTVCPKSYFFRYVERKPVVRDARDVIFGSVIGKVFEWFYARSVWKKPDPAATLLSYCEDAMEEVFAKEKFDAGADPSYLATLRNDLKTYVPAGVDTIREFRLLTPTSKAEEDLTQEYSRGGVTLKLGGKADFLHPATPTDVTLIDGKGGKHRGMYTDPQQIIWYGTLHYLKFHVAPTRIGFLYWRFPTEPLQWVDYGDDDVRKCINGAFEVAAKIRLKAFEPRPSSACRRCDFRRHCPEGKEYVSEREVSSAYADQSVFGIDRVV